jgi:16S rRNA processing protein RimM
VLVPFHREVVVEVHRDEGRLVIDPPEGLLDL